MHYNRSIVSRVIYLMLWQVRICIIEPVVAVNLRRHVLWGQQMMTQRWRLVRRRHRRHYDGGEAPAPLPPLLLPIRWSLIAARKSAFLQQQWQQQRQLCRAEALFGRAVAVPVQPPLHGSCCCSRGTTGLAVDSLQNALACCQPNL